MRQAWRVKQWGDPYGGGWMDWPAGLIDKMSVALNYYNAHKASANGSSNWAAWANANHDAFRLVTYVKQLRLCMERLDEVVPRLATFNNLDEARVRQDFEAAFEGKFSRVARYGVQPGAKTQLKAMSLGFTDLTDTIAIARAIIEIVAEELTWQH